MPQRKTKKLRSCVGLCSLLPDAQGEDYEEVQFANSMKKKKIKEGDYRKYFIPNPL